ncbi:hypothetical protein P168DRAFT_233966 [Aspergillus campestris IBT 28561]|uniref:Proteophosphoglycan 5 n=1 Tax=Aspergillus campestris (strain IBT 28561) TaxID=1392248 RepID=A0A2I1D668_ASPC2|nr:uncharacterized protein P168DRAFT_233966 [Aspergillus campestris IBT 28561]PKY05374.1 hypothetical protein P168DRAFT_233966 [Aspergillus campestris IBT 28561]
MSTQSPTPLTPKGPRNNRRTPKRNAIPSTQKNTFLSTPPSSPPRNLSPGGTATDSSVNVNMSKKKNGRSTKKPREGFIKASPAPPVNGHRHISSNTVNNNNGNAILPPRDSPHYAGPTFHASPAPSALPIPSFFSKSLPESDLAPALESDAENPDAEPDYETTPSKPKPRPQVQDGKPESTPLDFLFKAAVEARNVQPQRSPEATTHTRIRSPQTDSKTLRQRGFNDSSNGIFPFDMGSPEPRSSQIGPSFAPSYKDRMNAMRATNSPPSAEVELDEGQRKAKTEALKTLLLNPRPQRPSSASNLAQGPAERPKEHPNANLSIPHFATPLRTTSSPPGPIPDAARNNYQSMTANSFYPRPNYAHSGTPQQNVRQTHVPYDNTRSPGNYTPHAPVRHQSSPVRANPVGSPQVLDTKKMEDDLRKILKLDANPGFASPGIQSSYA